MEKDVTLETTACQVLLHCVIITHIASNDSPILVNIIFTLLMELLKITHLKFKITKQQWNCITSFVNMENP